MGREMEMNADVEKNKINVIANYIEEEVGFSPEELGSDKIYLGVAEAVLNNKPEVWQNARMYLRLMSRQVNYVDTVNFLDEQISYYAYVAKYGLELFGLDDIENGEEDIEKVALEFFKPGQTKLVDVDDLKDFDKLFEYPLEIKFTIRAHEEIIWRILNDEMTSRQVDFYLGTEDDPDFGFSKLYPALKHILQNTNDEHLFRTTGDVLSILWRQVPDDDKELDAWFNKELYEIFWPRVGKGDLQFLASEKQISDDALDWVVNNPDCKKLNPKLWRRLEELARDERIGKKEVLSPAAFGQICNIRTEKMSPAQKFDYVAKFYQGDDLYNFFCRPETIEEAEVYLEKAFDEFRFSFEACQEIIWNDGDPRRNNWRITVEAHKMILAENLDPEIHDFVVQYMNDNFDRVSWHSAGVAMQLLWAECSGANRQSEPRRIFAEKCRKVLIGDDLDAGDVDRALELAQKNIKFREFQKEDLRENLRKNVVTEE